MFKKKCRNIHLRYFIYYLLDGRRKRCNEVKTILTMQELLKYLRRSRYFREKKKCFHFRISENESNLAWLCHGNYWHLIKTAVSAFWPCASLFLELCKPSGVIVKLHCTKTDKFGEPEIILLGQRESSFFMRTLFFKVLGCLWSKKLTALVVNQMRTIATMIVVCCLEFYWFRTMPNGLVVCQKCKQFQSLYFRLILKLFE